jgi:4-hydroxy-tetrahydrodipicolinate reductase
MEERAVTEVAIGVAGVSGRMGQMLVREICAASGVRLAAASEAPGHGCIGGDAGTVADLDPLGIVVSDDVAHLFGPSQAVIDFTAPAASLAHASAAAETGTVHVIGTTGFTPGDEAALAKAAEKTVLVKAPNMSLGVNLLFALTQRVAGILGPDFDIEILELHHRHKADAPSGTALGLGRAAAVGRGVDLDSVAVMSREGQTGARRDGDIGFSVMRGGDVVGDHSVIFASEGERVELVHRASDRRIYARGAISAALWAQGREPGLYGMQDVLGLGD